MLKNTRYNGEIDKYGKVTFPIEKTEMHCKCGHDLTYHAHSQWRNYWMCEHHDCDCSNFELADKLAVQG